MTWRAVGASVAGTSHMVADRPCEDSHWIDVEARDPGHLLIAVADGAGSASHGLLGAESAVMATRRFCAQVLAPGAALDRSFAMSCLSAVTRSLRDLASELGLQERDIACTLLMVVATGEQALAVQVGDGGIVFGNDTGWHLHPSPRGGEYVNETRFVTDSDWAEWASIQELPGGQSMFAVFTDGIQRLAVDCASGHPHGPFFEPLFRTLRQAEDADVPALSAALCEFLRSPEVNKRTDDDKTLVLAVRGVYAHVRRCQETS